jgi:hypothetical protein
MLALEELFITLLIGYYTGRSSCDALTSRWKILIWHVWNLQIIGRRRNIKTSTIKFCTELNTKI